MVRNKSAFQRTLWCVTILMMVVLLFCHTYGDIQITTRHGMNLWKILFQGDFLNFFSLNHVQSGNVFYSAEQGASYNIVIYIVFAIWNIPLILLESFAGIDVMNNMLCLAYMKLLPIGATLLSAFLVKKLLDLYGLGEQTKAFLVYLYLSSSLILSVIFIMGQYDVLSLVLQLAGVYAFLKKDRRRFVIAFGIAFCFKYFAAVIFLPLLFLQEKKISKLFFALLGFLCPIFITNVPFWIFASAREGFALEITLLTKAFSTSSGVINLFVVFYVLALIWCYLKKQEEDAKLAWRQATWICFVCYASFFGLLDVYPYWMILLAPFLIFALLGISEHFRVGLLLESMGLVCAVFANLIKYDWCYFGNTMDSMLLSKLLGPLHLETSIIYGVVARLQAYPWVFPLFNSAFFACCCALAYLSYPKAETADRGIGVERTANEYTDVMVLRSIINAGGCLLPILSNFI